MKIWDFFSKKNEVDLLLSKVASDFDDERDEALEVLSKINLSLNEGIKVIMAATKEYRPAKYQWQTVASELLNICFKKPHFGYISKLLQVYDSLEPTAKLATMDFFARYDNEEALKAYIKILDKDYDKLSSLPTGSLYDNPRCVGILFPNLLKYTDNKNITPEIYLVLLGFFNDGKIDESYIADYKNAIIEDIRTYTDKILEYKIESEVRLWEDEEYYNLRSNAGIHFDLAGYIKDEKVIFALKELMRCKDAKLKMFAYISLIRLGEEVEEEYALQIASSNEVRNFFYGNLQSLGREALYPEEYKKQEYFAEADMVNWLVYPTELGRVPDKIELMEIFDTGEEEYYLFRFKCENSESWSDKGWMAGVSGPFDKADKPSVSAGGCTFSRFEAWGEKNPEDHFKDIVGNVQTYWKKRAEDLDS
ncbi:hypothetical protein [Clostridium manihotivorum]|uniref:Uncharacterized protein n=1 Tax=Clostridium manihotivorum TaxID=2320868 RepID=A0A3R5U6S5_9CLOT|nr:hypothetical protein [Clostridium manihotivorum]QAA33363.1 hypothetical protein C1I91_17870 [Clostridium manihotivorum]